MDIQTIANISIIVVSTLLFGLSVLGSYYVATDEEN
jgi:hypothetical protein